MGISAPMSFEVKAVLRNDQNSAKRQGPSGFQQLTVIVHEGVFSNQMFPIWIENNQMRVLMEGLAKHGLLRDRL